jgi:hypothetical protein
MAAKSLALAEAAKQQIQKNEAPGGSFFFRTALQTFLIFFCTSI